MTSTRTRYDELRATGKLPTPSGVALAVIQLCRDESSNARDLADVLRTDPALTGRLLNFCNSAAIGRRSVATVREAVAYLGMKRVRQLALSFSLLDRRTPELCLEFDYERFWSESLIRALVAEQLAAEINSPRQEELFTVSLLYSIGTLGLASTHPEEFSTILAQSGGFRDRLLELEREQFAIDHRDLSVLLMREWGIPDHYLTAFEGSAEQLKRTNDNDVVRSHLILTGANDFARVCFANRDRIAEIAFAMRASCRELGINENRIPPISQAAIAQWREWSVQFELQRRPVPDIAYCLLEAKPSNEPSPKAVVGSAEETVENPESPIRLLVIDDSTFARNRIGECLEPLGLETIYAENGQEAIEQLLLQSPDMVLTDWEMPGMDGIELCRTIRSMKIGREIYIVMLTAQDDEDTLVAAFDAGVDDYIAKPFLERTLRSRIRAGMRLVEMQRRITRDRMEIERQTRELAVTNRKLRHAALTDPLTRLPNRRAVFERLEQVWKAARQRDNVFSCMMLDLDRFKQINDQHGHGVGDTVLQTVATELNRALFPSDFVGRIGGEEFVVICEGTEAAEAFLRAELLREAVAGHAISCNDVELAVTVSIGVAEYRDSDRDVDEVIRRADEALYQAKSEGGNHVVNSVVPVF